MRSRSIILAALGAVLVSVSGCASGKRVHSDAACFGSDPACLAQPAAVAEARDLALPPSALAYAVETAPVVKAAEARIDAAGAEIGKAKAMFLPAASLDAGSTLRASRRHPALADAPDNPYSYALNVRVPIYQGGRAQSALKVAEAAQRVAVAGARDVTLATAYEAALAVAEVEEHRRALEILKRHEGRLATLAADIASERTAGAATSVDTGDVARQRAAIAVNRQTVAMAMARAEEALLRLGLTRGSVGIETLSGLSRRLPADEAGLLALARANNPRLGERARRIEVAQARVEQAAAAYNPSLSLDLSAGGSGHETGFERMHEASARVSLSVPLYTGGAREAEIRGRKDELLATTLDHDAALSGVRAAILSAKQRLVEARAMLSAAETEQAAATRLLDGVRQERRLGERSVFDEIRTIGDVASADLNRNAARAGVLSAEITLAAETGLLGDRLGMSTCAQEGVRPTRDRFGVGQCGKDERKEHVR
ncbi:TolC family protein [Ensifer soli]|uniref:TolC family protein n=1 Tax=Ciceribacter sp. sgz301302 TaxID=3342379 RepID=UPI0035B88E23